MAAGGRTYLAGFKEAREVLQELSRGVQRGVGKRALQVPAELIAGAVRAKAPVSNRAGNPTPGSLRGSIKVVPSRTVKGSVRVAVLAEDIAAVPNEFGTSKMPAQPFFRPAADATRDAAGRAFGAALKPEVEKAAAKAAAKGLKG
jgi:HK97 gp10 family phage protein